MKDKTFKKLVKMYNSEWMDNIAENLDNNYNQRLFETLFKSVKTFDNRYKHINQNQKELLKLAEQKRSVKNVKH